MPGQIKSPNATCACIAKFKSRPRFSINFLTSHFPFMESSMRMKGFSQVKKMNELLALASFSVLPPGSFHFFLPT